MGSLIYLSAWLSAKKSDGTEHNPIPPETTRPFCPAFSGVKSTGDCSRLAVHRPATHLINERAATQLI